METLSLLAISSMYIDPVAIDATVFPVPLNTCCVFSFLYSFMDLGVGDPVLRAPAAYAFAGKLTILSMSTLNRSLLLRFMGSKGSIPESTSVSPGAAPFV